MGRSGRTGARFALVAAIMLPPLIAIDVPARADAPFCTYVEPSATEKAALVVQVDCLPTPVDCALGRAPVHAVRRDEPSAFAMCDGGGGTIRTYSAGMPADETGLICGLTIRDDRVVASSRGNFYIDSNQCPAKQPDHPHRGSRYHDGAQGGRGVVATVDPQATAAAVEVLRRGGNAVDAAVAAVFAVGVVNPGNCGIGGGGFLVARTAAGEFSLDFRETAPAAMRDSNDLYVGRPVDLGTGPRVVGVPGVVAGMTAALDRLGTKPLAEVLAPAIALASSSTVSMDAANTYLGWADAPRKQEDRLRQDPEAARIHLPRPGGTPPGPGNTFVQADYAESLQEIATHGPGAFYDTEHPHGTIADDLARFMHDSRGGASPEAEHVRANAHAGLMTADDLRAYRPIWREPIRGTYRGHKVIVAPPPNSGGIQLLEMLNILEGVDVAERAFGSVDWAHWAIETHKIAVADRDAHVGDPAFVRVPTQQLTSKRYGDLRRGDIGYEAQDSYLAGTFGGASPRRPTSTPPDDGSHTTHVSVMDAAGNAVAVTCTLEQFFGAGVIAPGTGFLLNNQLTDFTRYAGEPDPNHAAPGKRPRSNMTPFIVTKDDRPVLVAGGAGSGMIPVGALHLVLDTVDYGMTGAEAMDAPRVWAAPGNWLALRTSHTEPGRLPGVAAGLADRGHTMGNDYPGGAISFSRYYDQEYFPVPVMQAVGASATGRWASSDPRAFTVAPAAE